VNLPALLALTLAAASSTRPVLQRRHPLLERAAGERVAIVYGATGSLARQLENGAPFDLFLGADEESAARLARDGHLERETVVAYARGTLVLVAAEDAHVSLPKLLDGDSARSLFARPFRRLAIASPRVAPYGRAGLDVLARAGVLAAVRARVVEAENVEQALAFVSSGNAELGFVAASLHAPRVVVVPIAAALYDPVVHAGGIVSRSTRREAARRVLADLAGPAARDDWAAFGYLPPGPGR
jgi:molybdate transport system substrate-binding protein